MPDFRQLLDTSFDDVSRPLPWPNGTYHGIIAKYEFIESSKQKTPGVELTLTVTGAGDDIDPEALAASKADFSKRQQRITFWLTEDARYRYKEFCQSCGIDLTGRGIGEVTGELVGQTVLIDLSTRPRTRDGKENLEELVNQVSQIRGTQG